MMQPQVEQLAIRTSLEGVAHLLRDRPLDVPPFQRSYSWIEEQVDQFWGDLRAAMRLPRNQYFLGTIVLTPGEEGRMTIIDGQQRLATTTMVLAAIRNYYLEVSDQNRAGVIEQAYIATRDLRTAELEPRLKLNKEDDQFFRRAVVARPGAEVPTTEYESNRRILGAFRSLTEHLEREIEDAGPNRNEVLFRWTEFLESGVLVIVVRVPNEADAFLIFETLNDRGLELTIPDLLKNYLFGLSRDAIDEIQASWLHTIEQLDIQAEEQTFTDFLRHYWSSMHGATRERELYQGLRSKVRSREEAISLVMRLESAATRYAALLNPLHDYWPSLDEVDAEVHSLLRLKLEQNRPLLLAALEAFDPSEVKRLLRGLISWSVRGLVVGGIGGGTMERYYCDAAVQIRTNKASDTGDVFEALAQVVPTDDTFRSAFEERRVFQTRLARYYLLALEKALLGHDNPALVTPDEEAEVRLEHVLPRRADAEQWPTFAADEIGQWALRLGNMVLLRRDTRGLGNVSWDEARKVLRSSGRPLAEQASEAESWTPETIRDRQRQLAELALQVWPREP